MINILTKKKLHEMVEILVRTEDLSYIEALIHVCEEKNLDPIDIVKLISPTLKSKIELEAMSRNRIYSINTLKKFLE